MNISGIFQSPAGFRQLSWNVQGPKGLPNDSGLSVMHQGPNGLPPDPLPLGPGGLPPKPSAVIRQIQVPGGLPPNERKNVPPPSSPSETRSQLPELEKHIQGLSLPYEKQDQSKTSIRLSEIAAHHPVPRRESLQINNTLLATENFAPYKNRPEKNINKQNLFSNSMIQYRYQQQINSVVDSLFN
jgi:hypothetical protein